MNKVHMSSLPLTYENLDITINPKFNYLRVKAHKYGHIYKYLEIDKDDRKISDILKLIYKFYNSKIPDIYLVTLSQDEMRDKAHYIYKKEGFVLWKHIVGNCIFKELTIDCCRNDALELMLSFSFENM